MSSLENMCIVITGGNSGIGFQILSELMDRPGNRILVADKSIDAVEGISDNVVAMKIDISSMESIDSLFERANEEFGRIDAFFANAGFSYYEEIGGADWDHITKIYDTNVISVIYAYERYVQYLNGRNGIYAITGSAMGFFGMPGFTLYSSTKSAISGFQDAIRYERPQNVQVTTLFPVSTDTNFFRTASEKEFRKPFPVQTPEHVARKYIAGIEKGKREVYPSALFRVSMFFFRVIPPIKWAYMRRQKKHFDEFRK